MPLQTALRHAFSSGSRKERVDVLSWAPFSPLGSLRKSTEKSSEVTLKNENVWKYLAEPFLCCPDSSKAKSMVSF